MVRTYINFCGPGNSGKTTTLNNVIEKLKEIPNCKIIEKVPRQTSKDCRIALEIVVEGKKHKVAISTWGDSLEHLQKNHSFFDRHTPEVMVTASHCHKDYEHNLFIENYVHNPINAENKGVKNKEPFNYIKIHSVKLKEGDVNIKDKNEYYAQYLYNLIIESLKFNDSFCKQIKK